MADQPRVAYILFDVESVADGTLVSQVRYPQECLEPADAIRRYRQELKESGGSDFIPYTHQIPISIVVGKVDASFRLLDYCAGSSGIPFACHDRTLLARLGCLRAADIGQLQRPRF